jgi:hypothetical protein
MSYKYIMYQKGYYNLLHIGHTPSNSGAAALHGDDGEATAHRRGDGGTV